MDSPAQGPRPVLSVHDTARRTPTGDLARLQEALDRFPEAGTSQDAAARMLEEEVARTVGAEAAVLLPTGKMAQQLALRVHADRRPGRRVVLAHPLNHLSVHEEQGLDVLHDLHVRPVGDRYALATTTDIEAGTAPGDVAALLLELPARELGGELPSWEDLQAQLAVAHAAGAATHLDGARLLQALPCYDRPPAEVCAGFDSVYLSLYKDLEAPVGAVLAGDAQLVAAVRMWAVRLGGTVGTDWPVALLGLDGLHRALAEMPRYAAHARALAAAITDATPARTRPVTPQAAMFHLLLPVPLEAARRAHEQAVAEGHPRLGLRLRPAQHPRWSWCEVTIGRAALELTPEQVVAAVRRVLELGGA